MGKMHILFFISQRHKPDFCNPGYSIRNLSTKIAKGIIYICTIDEMIQTYITYAIDKRQ